MHIYCRVNIFTINNMVNSFIDIYLSEPSIKISFINKA